MKYRIFIIINITVLLIFAVIMCTQKDTILSLLPSENETEGWKEDEGRILRTVQEMSDYMNGGAGLYFSYDFVQLGLKRFVNDDGLEFTVELYEMKDVESAYGVLSFDLTGSRVDIGTIGMYDRGLLRFWRGKYFCRIQMWEGYVDYGEIILETGRGIVERIGGSGDRIPELVNFLPEEGLEETSVHYFFHNTPLNNFYYISNDDILHLQDDARGVIASYSVSGEESFYVMVIKYADERLLAESYRRFVQIIFNKKVKDKPAGGNYRLIEKTGDDSYGGIDREGTMLLFVLDAGSKDISDKYLDRVINRILK